MTNQWIILATGLLLGIFVGYAFRHSRQWRADRRAVRDERIAKRWNYRQAQKHAARIERARASARS